MQIHDRLTDLLYHIILNRIFRKNKLIMGVLENEKMVIR